MYGRFQTSIHLLLAKRQKNQPTTSWVSTNSKDSLSSNCKFKRYKRSDTVYDPKKHELKNMSMLSSTSVVWTMGFKRVYEVNGPLLVGVAGCDMCYNAAKENSTISWVVIRLRT